MNVVASCISPIPCFGMYADKGNVMVNIGGSSTFVIILFKWSSAETPGSLKDFITPSPLKSVNVSDPSSSLLVI